MPFTPIKTSYKTALLLTTFGLAGMAHADFIGLYAGADYWQTSTTANLAQHGTPAQSFDVKSAGIPSFQASFDHPIPLIPNIRVRHSQLSLNSNPTTTAFTFNNTVYAGSTTLKTNLSNTDATLYYRILDNVVKAYVGLNAKLVSGDVTVNSTLSSGDNTVNFNQVIPMLYLSAGGKLPFTGFSAKAEINTLKYKNSNVTDASAEVKYDFIKNVAVDLGLKGGYRILNMELVDVASTDAKMDIKGPFLGLEAHF